VRLGQRTVTLEASQRPCQRDGATTRITDVLVPPAAWAPGPFRWSIAGRELAGLLPALPALDAPVRVAVVGARNYPDGLALGRLAVAMGGPVQMVLVAGPGRQRILGRGGWEHAIPVVLLCDGGEDPAVDVIAPGCRRPHGVVWGCLGLSCAAADADWPGAIATQLCTWRIPVLAEPRWDPGLLARAALQEPEDLRSLVALASGLQVPAILQCGGRAGFISEPLLNRAGVLRSLEGGVRILGATPAGEGLAGLGETIAVPLPGMAIVGLDARADSLGLVVAGGDEPVVELAWTRSPSGELHGSGSGDGDVLEAWRAWRAGDESRLAAAAWAAISGLQRVALTREDGQVLVEASGGGAGRIAARRYLGRPDGGPLPEGAPEWLVRERALRELGRNAVVPGGAAATALVEGGDEEILHAAVRRLDGPQRGLILDLLAERLRRYGETGVPDVVDPLVRHRVVSAVFDAPERSPTPLRALALALRPRLDPLARGPVERFLARHGEVRR
jgi:hypothetical protein